MNKENLLVVDAASLFTPENRFSPGRLLIQGSLIAEVGPPEKVRIPAEVKRIDASSLLVAPGFIDPHVHGAGGADVMDGTFDSVNAVSRTLARHGTTAFLPTTVSSPADVLTQAVEQLGSVMLKSFDGAQPLGIHLEGPFINAAKRGTHNSAHVMSPDPHLLEEWIQRSRGTMRLLTVAPELDGIDRLFSIASRGGVRLAMGHSDATFDEAKSGADRGIAYAVHTFNAMRAFFHRDPGIVGEVLADDRIFAEIIADGIHVDQAVVRFFARAKGKSRVLLVTDAISATSMPNGRYRLGDDFVDVVNGICRNAEGRLAGSTLTQDVALKNFVEWTRWPLEEALSTLTLNPARALKLEKKGVLEPGADADLAIMDQNFRIVMTLVSGQVVFRRDL